MRSTDITDITKQTDTTQQCIDANVYTQTHMTYKTSYSAGLDHPRPHAVRGGVCACACACLFVLLDCSLFCLLACLFGCLFACSLVCLLDTEGHVAQVPFKYIPQDVAGLAAIPSFGIGALVAGIIVTSVCLGQNIAKGQTAVGAFDLGALGKIQYIMYIGIKCNY